jgi:biofilm protein TabA
MILDTIAHADRYLALHPAFAAAFRFLRDTDLDALPSGRNEIDGDAMFVIIDRQDGRGHGGARLEAHRRYIDIQYTIHGGEEIGWAPLAACASPEAPFDAERDIVFFRDAPACWLGVPRGSFAVFFPDDAHAPLAATGALTKAIVKISAAALETPQLRNSATPK